MSESRTPWYKNGFLDAFMKAFAGFLVGILVWILAFGFPLSEHVMANTNEVDKLTVSVTQNTGRIDVLSEKLDRAATKEDLRQAVTDIREYIKALVPPDGR